MARTAPAAAPAITFTAVFFNWPFVAEVFLAPPFFALADFDPLLFVPADFLPLAFAPPDFADDFVLPFFVGIP